jgi:hypothetical protein
MLHHPLNVFADPLVNGFTIGQLQAFRAGGRPSEPLLNRSLIPRGKEFGYKRKSGGFGSDGHQKTRACGHVGILHFAV